MSAAAGSIKSKGKQLLNLRKSLSLPNLCQGGTLSIRSSPRVRLNVRLTSQWRDDAYVTLEQTLPPLPPSRRVQGNVHSDVEQEAGMRVDETLVKKGKGDTPHVSISVDLKSRLTGATNATTDKSTLELTAVKIEAKSPFSATSELESEFSSSLTSSLTTTDGNTVTTDDTTIFNASLPKNSFGNESSSTVQEVEYHDKIARQITKSCPRTHHLPTSLVLTVTVPEKLNVVCHLPCGGDIMVKGKLEGDDGFDLRTSNGTILVDKLRGESISIVNGEEGGIVYASQLIEAQTVKIDTGRNGRVRAKMINASDVTINVGVDDIGKDSSSFPSLAPNKLDVDDALAKIDIGSLYTSSQGRGAYLNVTDIANTANSHVRVKSNHGHVSVCASLDTAADTNDWKSMSTNLDGNPPVPVVDLGGVNGSCDVSVHRTKNSSAYSLLSPNNIIAARVHVDSMSPEAISIITSQWGDVALTLDRKVETDVRMLSCPLLDSFPLNTIMDLDDGDHTSNEAVAQLLFHHDGKIEECLRGAKLDVANGGGQDGTCREAEKNKRRILIKTNSFTKRSVLSKENDPILKHVEYIDGYVECKSLEPDSRFDRKVRGRSTFGSKPDGNNAVGKIRIKGAAAQALRGFTRPHQNQSIDHSEYSDEEAAASFRPLLVVATNGRISLESVSWVGAIARRYGMTQESRRNVERHTTTGTSIPT